MKKLYFFLALFLSFLFINPNSIKADGINKYYMNATVLSNGDLEVEEYIDLNGDYNGYERIIKYANENAEEFNENNDSLGGNKLHNADDIQIISVKGVNKSSDDIDTLFTNLIGDEFTKVNYANTGSYGKYTEEYIFNGTKIRIYNNYKAFYIKYIIKNLGVLYNDYAEIGWNIFTEQKEDIKDFKLQINIPNNKNELRSWAHGQLDGNIKLSGKNKVYVTIKDYDASYPFDVRVLFDRENIINSTKNININAFDKILKYENKKADEANKIRNKARLIINTIRTIDIILIILLILLMIRTYLKFDKEYVARFKNKYFRDFPSDKSPSSIEYLTKKQITTNSLSATILNLIYKKIINFTKIDKDYKLELVGNEESLSKEEKSALKFVFEDKKETLLSDVKRKGKKDYNTVINNYNSWRSDALQNANQYNFFENNKTNKFRLTILGLIILFINIFIFMSLYPQSILNVILLITTIIFIIYTLVSTKKTKEGIEEYSKWIALKRFLNDFGRFEEKDLPQIVLWEKYLVYATVFGIAEKLSKEMQIKINNNSYYDSYPHYHNYSFTDVVIFNNIMNTSISSSYNNACSARAAASSNSSGSGFGGGFSSGGGSFGGGGGGGRF